MGIFIKEFTDYLAGLAALHKEIKDSTFNRAFCRYQDNAQLEQLRMNASKNIMVIMNFFGRAAGEFDDAEVRPTIVIRFSSYAKTVSSADITIAEEKAFEILMDFWVRLRHDFEEDNCLWLKFIDWQNIQFDTMDGPMLVNHYGWDLVIPYKTYLPAYDSTRWEAEV
jgi:hypothetical protein